MRGKNEAACDIAEHLSGDHAPSTVMSSRITDGGAGNRNGEVMKIKTYTLTLDPDRVEQLRKVAAGKGLNLSSMIRLLISDSLKAEARRDRAA
jgi:hypothetical protein